MTLNNLEFALYKNNLILLERIRNIQSSFDNKISVNLKEIEEQIQQLNDDLKNHIKDSGSLSLFKIVTELPTIDISVTTIYLLPTEKQEQENYYDEYIFINNQWELIGNTKIDLSDYLTKADLSNLSVLKNLSEQDGKLFYLNKQIQSDISKKANNKLVQEQDGLFVNGYSESEIREMIDRIWKDKIETIPNLFSEDEFVFFTSDSLLLSVNERETKSL